jgi:hypothetical protein
MGWYDRRTRRVRDLPCGDARIFLETEVRRVRCKGCGQVKSERLDFLADNPFYTKRFAYYVGRRCRQTTIKDVAEEFRLHWETIKTLEMQYMRAQLAKAGARVPLHCTASGKLFLSQMTPTQVRRVLGTDPLKRYTKRTITSVDALEKALRKVRADRVGTDIDEYLKGSVCLAVPVTDRDGRICTVVALQGRAPRMTLKKGIEYLPALRRAAKALAETIGQEDESASLVRKAARVGT